MLYILYMLYIPYDLYILYILYILYRSLHTAKDMEFDDPNVGNLAEQVSRRQKETFSPPAIDETQEPRWVAPGEMEVNAEMICGRTVHILVVDCGVKNNILRYLVNVLRVKVTRPPTGNQ